MNKKKVILALLIFTICLTGKVSAFTIQWDQASSDNLLAVGGFDVLEYRDATGDSQLGPGIFSAGDWEVNVGQGGFFGGGSYVDGNGENQTLLWLISTPATAYTTLTVKSDAVGFMMGGDLNDGFAQFRVDGIDIGTFDMFHDNSTFPYHLGELTLIVSGLDYGFHTLEVIQLGIQNNESVGDDIAIYGGAALSTPVPEPSTLLLLGFGLFGLVIFSKKSNPGSKVKYVVDLTSTIS